MNSKRSVITILVCLSAVCGAHAQTITITNLGAHSDGSNVEATTAAFQQAFNNYPNGRIIVPAGTYSIDNTQGAMYIPDFNGEIDFQGNAELVFQTTAHGGLRFVGGSGARIHGLNGIFATTPTQRGEDAFSFTSLTDLTIEDAIAQNSPGIGFDISLCIRPKLSNITVSNTLADGLVFGNSLNGQLINYTATNTADNGLAFYNYPTLANLNGGSATNVHVSQITGAHGIAVVGTSNVVISDFVIDSTAASGIWIAADPSFQMGPATNVIVQHGVILNAGTLPMPPIGSGNTYGIEYDTSSNVLFSDIRIVGSASRGVSGESPNGNIRLHDIRVVNNLTSDAFDIDSTAFVEIADCVSENSPNNGFSFNQVGTVVARDLKVIDASSQSSLNRAIWFENGNVVLASGLSVIDDRSTAVGYVVGASDSALGIQKGSVQGITSAISAGSLVTNQYSPGVAWSNVH